MLRQLNCTFGILCPVRVWTIGASLAVALIGIPGVAESAVTACFGSQGVGLCLPGTSPCQVSGPMVVAPDAVLDCGAADLVVANGLGKLTVSDGTMTIRAHNLTIETTRDLVAIGDDSTDAGIVIELTGSLNSWGTLTAKNFGTGSHIRITAGLDIVLQPRDDVGVGIDITGSGQGVDGGDLVLQAGRDVYLGSKILSNGNDGTSSANQNSGGDVQLIAGSGVYVNQLIRGYGRWFNGGSVMIRAGGDVEINNDGASGSRKGEVDLSARGTDGDGGDLDIEAGNRVLLSGPIELGSGTDHTGGDARGGDLSIESGCGGTRLEDTVDLTGGSDGGGNLEIAARGNVAVAGSVDASARQSGGNGGDISISSSMGSLVLEGTTQLHANANVTTTAGLGIGGNVTLSACQVDVAAGALVESTGQAKGNFEIDSYKQGSALQNSFGIRVSETADVSAASTSGQILLRAASVVSGYCSNSLGTACQLDSDCNVGNCSTGDCLGGNPQTDGQVVQFSSIPLIQQDATLGSCAASCQ